MAASSFRATKWDPIYIVSQIVALQSLSYLVFSVILYIALTLIGTADASLDLIFDDSEIRTDTGFGWSLIILWVVHAFASIPILTWIVQRARQILDFVLTFHFLHLCLCWYFNARFPTSIAWWLLQLTAIIIMTFGGEWACMRSEMKPILITGGGTSSRSTSNNKNNDIATAVGAEPDIELGNMAGSSNSDSSFNDRHGEESRTALLEDDALSRSDSPMGRMKRKTSDGLDFSQQQQREDEDSSFTDDNQGPLLSAVGKAKEVLLTKKKSASKSKRKSRQKYDKLPMKDIDDTTSNH